MKYYTILSSTNSLSCSTIKKMFMLFSITKINLLFLPLYHKNKNKMKNNMRTATEEVYGEIVAIEKEHVVIDCLIDERMVLVKTKKFNKERHKQEFDKLPIKEGQFVNIRVNMFGDSATFKFEKVDADISHMFRREDGTSLTFENSTIVKRQSKIY